MTGEARRLERFPIHLGRGGSAAPQPEMTGRDWYDDYERRTEGDGADGRLVSLFAFDSPWDVWEMHPAGDEVVLCLEGSLTLLQELADGSRQTTTLAAGDFAINPPGVWHTADCDRPVRALFITAGAGTLHRPREA